MAEEEEKERNEKIFTWKDKQEKEQEKKGIEKEREKNTQSKITLEPGEIIKMTAKGKERVFLVVGRYEEEGNYRNYFHLEDYSI